MSSHVPRVRLSDLIPSDGLASDVFKQTATLLYQYLRDYNFAVIHLSPSDAILLKCVLDSARLFFHQRAPPGPESIHTDEPLKNWHRTTGYYSEPHFARETFDFRPGIQNESMEPLPPAGLSDLFPILGMASRHILEAIGWALELDSFSFTKLLDNVPLKNGQVSSSVLSVSCHSRPGLHHSPMDLTALYDGHEIQNQADKGLITLIKSDRHGLEVRDTQGRWHIADRGLGPSDIVLVSGLSLQLATGGALCPTPFRIDSGSSHMHMYGRCSAAFKLMPRADGLLHCLTAGAAVASSSPFQPIAVRDFMQRAYPIEQLITRHAVANFPFPTPSDGPMKSLKRRKQTTRAKPLAPSKRLRLEAQRVLKEKVQEIAESKNLKIRFCNFKECEEHHLTTLDSPCAALRAELGWPHGVPFVHPHDLPNKAKEAFLVAYEPTWSAGSPPDVELGLIEAAGHLHPHH